MTRVGFFVLLGLEGMCTLSHGFLLIDSVSLSCCLWRNACILPLLTFSLFLLFEKGFPMLVRNMRTVRTDDILVLKVLVE